MWGNFVISTALSILWIDKLYCVDLGPSLREPPGTVWRSTILFLSANKKPNYYIWTTFPTQACPQCKRVDGIVAGLYIGRPPTTSFNTINLTNSNSTYPLCNFLLYYSQITVKHQLALKYSQETKNKTVVHRCVTSSLDSPIGPGSNFHQLVNAGVPHPTVVLIVPFIGKAHYQAFFWVLIDLIVELVGLIIKPFDNQTESWNPVSNDLIIKSFDTIIW